MMMTDIIWDFDYFWSMAEINRYFKYSQELLEIGIVWSQLSSIEGFMLFLFSKMTFFCTISASNIDNQEKAKWFFPNYFGILKCFLGSCINLSICMSTPWIQNWVLTTLVFLVNTSSVAPIYIKKIIYQSYNLKCDSPPPLSKIGLQNETRINPVSSS